MTENESRAKGPNKRAVIGIFVKKPVRITAYQAYEEEVIETLEGIMTAAPTDWVITGVKGERYPCKDDIFRMTYEVVRETGND